jgi:hypothetical protein
MAQAAIHIVAVCKVERKRLLNIKPETPQVETWLNFPTWAGSVFAPTNSTQQASSLLRHLSAASFKIA